MMLRGRREAGTLIGGDHHEAIGHVGGVFTRELISGLKLQEDERIAHNLMDLERTGAL